MIVQAPLFLHPDQVLINSRQYKPPRSGTSSILLTGSGILLVKNRCRHSRRFMHVYLAVYDYESIHNFDDFLLSVPSDSTSMLPFEHPEGRPISIHIHYPGLRRGLRVCVLARTPWSE